MSIEEICEKYKINNYEINEDDTIDVYGNVDLWDKKLNKIPLNFNKVTVNFSCSHNNLTSLEGCPKWVGGDFSCHYNKLLDIDCGIQMVDGNFYCQNNKITTLKGSPKSVGSFYCYKNQITNLKGCTKYIGGEFDCSDNELTSLEGCPKSIGQRFYADSNCLSDLDFIPDSMGGGFYCDNNILESVFNGVNIDFLRAFKSFKIIQDNVVNLKRLKYLMSMFDKPIKIEEIEKYYTIK